MHEQSLDFLFIYKSYSKFKFPLLYVFSHPATLLDYFHDLRGYYVIYSILKYDNKTKYACLPTCA